MKFGKILTAITDGALNTYSVKYEQQYERFLEMFTPKDYQEMAITQILLLTDSRPQSLVAISFAMKIADSTGSELLCLTEGVHSEVIQGEADKLGIITRIKESEKYSSEVVEEIFNSNNCALIIINHTHPLVDEIQGKINCSILRVKSSQFVKEA